MVFDLCAMRKILLICGSGSDDSVNSELLRLIAKQFADSFSFNLYDNLRLLPLFTVQRFKRETPSEVADLRQRVESADAVIISTPEYLHNIPAVVKNALEWMTESGELAEKPVLPITFTPHEPRGEHAMRSLVQSLKASKAKVVAELPLYQNQLRNDKGGIMLDDEHVFLFREALNLL
jgi:chromate reductase